MKIRTIRLELLRHGPPNNQLLSPLTRYLGVCGKVGVTSISIPYEHQVLLDRLDRLRHHPGRDPASSHAILARTGAEVTAILEANPGLVPQLHDGANHDQALMELQIVLSATELSLIPFEIAKVPEGCIGSPASWLATQNKAPVCITRGTRSMTHPPVRWPDEPRILFITADVPEQLVVAHLRALFEAMDPWLPEELRRNHGMPSANDPTGDRIANLLEHMLVFCPNGSLSDVREACAAAGPFTHVHILAHGARDPHKPGNQVGVALLNPQKTGREVIGAERLASALGGSMHRRCNQTGKGLPVVVTLANCDIASAGDVVYSHGSFAHLMHEEGVPVVFGAQFPLTFNGSIRMTSSIYTHLLRGDDPRIALHEARRALFTGRECGNHDWASLVGYIALPPDIDDQLPRHFYRRQKQVIDNILHSIDRCGNGASCNQGANADCHSGIKPLLDRLDRETANLPDDPCFATEALALKGSIAKRKAQVLHRQNRERTGEILRELRKAKRLYRKAAEAAIGETETGVVKKRSPHWSLTQYLSLQLVLCGRLPSDDMEKWHTALYSARVDMTAPNGSDRQIWAYASAMELNLLRYACCADKGGEYAATAKRQARFIRDHGADFPVASSRRQMRRYVDWWSEILPADRAQEAKTEKWGNIRNRLKRLATELCETLEGRQCP